MAPQTKQQILNNHLKDKIEMRMFLRELIYELGPESVEKCLIKTGAWLKTVDYMYREEYNMFLKDPSRVVEGAANFQRPSNRDTVMRTACGKKIVGAYIPAVKEEPVDEPDDGYLVDYPVPGKSYRHMKKVPEEFLCTVPLVPGEYTCKETLAKQGPTDFSIVKIEENEVRRSERLKKKQRINYY